MHLTLGLPVDTCPNCGGRMKLRALVRDPESIERFLRHQGPQGPQGRGLPFDHALSARVQVEGEGFVVVDPCTRPGLAIAFVPSLPSPPSTPP